MNRFFYILILFFTCNSLLAQISGTLNGDTLKAELSPYHVVGNVDVQDLIIEPGVTILFDDDYNFDIDRGLLKAVGFFSDSIIFKPDINNSNGWKGLKFKDCLVPSTLKYCRIEGSSDYGIKVDDGLAPEIFNCKIISNLGNGLELIKTQVQFSNCIIENNVNNGLFLNDAQIIISNSIVTRNANVGVLCSDTKDSLNLINSVVADNLGTGVASAGGYVSVKNSIIYYNNIEISSDTSNTDVTYSNVRRTPVYPGTGNINYLPQFNDLNIYTLSPSSSPCIDSGDPNSIYDDIYFPPSLGSIRNDMGAYGGPLAKYWFPPLYIQPNSLDFGRVSFDSTAMQTLNIKNYRDSTITADSIYFTGNDTSVFSTPTNYLNVSVLDSAQINLFFTPDRQDNFFSLFELQTLKHGRVNIPVQGEGVVAEIEYFSNQIDFGTVTLGDTSTIKFELLSTGNDTLRIHQIFTTNTNFVASDSFLNINPNNTVDSILISFIPDSIDLLTDSLILLTNDPDEGRIAIPLYGQGFGPVIIVDSLAYNFGSVFLTSDSSLLIPIRNNGNDSLLVNSIQIIDNDSNTFKILNDSLTYPIIIEPDSVFAVDLEFEPKSLGIDSARLVIRNNDAFSPNLSRILAGNGVAPIIGLNQTNINFGEIPFNTSAIDSIVIKNTGNFSLLIGQDSLFITGVDSEFFNIDSVGPFEISPGDSQKIYINFDADSEGVKQADLQIVSNDPFNRKDTVQLSGESWAPEISISDTALNFGEVIKDSVSFLSTYIYNSGQGDLVIFEDSLMFTGTDAIYFQIASINKSTISESDSALITIQFTADKPQTNQAILNIISNDPDSIPQIELSAFVLIPFIDTSHSIIEFGSIPLFTEEYKTLTIYNVGYEPLTVYLDSLEISGTDPQFFSFDTSLSDSTIQPNDSLEIILGFNASEEGIKNSILQIKSDDPVLPELTVTLVGSSDTPQIVLSDSIFDFGIVPATTDTSFKLIIHNKGYGNLILYEEGFFLGGTDSLSFNVNPLDSNITVNPQDSIEFNIELITDEVGPKLAFLQIRCNNFEDTLKTVNLTGLIIDNQPADIKLEQHSSTELNHNEKGNLRFIILTNFPTDSVKLYYKQGGEEGFNTVRCSNPTQMNLWEITIDSSWFASKGFEYFVRVYHGWRITDWPTKPRSLQVNIDNVEFPESTRKEVYQKISIPFNTSNQSLNTLFSDNLGSYDNTKYRIFDCENGVDYTEITNLYKELPPGKSLWLITKDEVVLDFMNAKTLPTDTTFRLSLHAGWNMISTPFAFPINWEDNDDKHKIRYYDSNGDWPFVTVLEPFKGYAVRVGSDTVIFINPKEYSGSTNLAKQIIFDDFIWTINLKVEQDKLRDHYNFVGTKNNASEGIDRNDYPEPPPIGNFVSLYFMQQNEITGNNEKFSTDIQKEYAEGHIYDFEVKGNVSGKKILIIEPHSIPAEFSYIVVNPESKIKYKTGNIELFSNYNKLQLIIGTEQFVNSQILEYNYIPNTFKLEQNYPNPFNPSTTIKYELPQLSQLSVNIYNVLGQKVKSLLNNTEKDAGYYQIKWDGRNGFGSSVATGIYILRFQADQYSKSIKMLLQK